MVKYYAFHFQNNYGQWSKQIEKGKNASEARPNSFDITKFICYTEHNTLKEAQQSKPRNEFLPPCKQLKHDGLFKEPTESELKRVDNDKKPS